MRGVVLEGTTDQNRCYVAIPDGRRLRMVPSGLRSSREIGQAVYSDVKCPHRNHALVDGDEVMRSPLWFAVPCPLAHVLLVFPALKLYCTRLARGLQS